jgi:hypothetical protein
MQPIGDLRIMGRTVKQHLDYLDINELHELKNLVDNIYQARTRCKKYKKPKEKDTIVLMTPGQEETIRYVRDLEQKLSGLKIFCNEKFIASIEFHLNKICELNGQRMQPNWEKDVRKRM